MTVITYPIPGLPSSWMVTANLANVLTEHVAAHIHALFLGEGYWPSINITS